MDMTFNTILLMGSSVLNDMSNHIEYKSRLEEIRDIWCDVYMNSFKSIRTK
jgi:hypothetical protein